VPYEEHEFFGRSSLCYFSPGWGGSQSRRSVEGIHALMRLVAISGEKLPAET
jgi:hypothetical protein